MLIRKEKRKKPQVSQWGGGREGYLHRNNHLGSRPVSVIYDVCQEKKVQKGVFGRRPVIKGSKERFVSMDRRYI